VCVVSVLCVCVCVCSLSSVELCDVLSLDALFGLWTEQSVQHSGEACERSEGAHRRAVLVTAGDGVRMTALTGSCLGVSVCVCWGRRRGQDFEAALKVIDEQLSTGPTEYPLYVKALIKRQQGEIQASLQLFQAATVLNPTNLANLKQASPAPYEHILPAPAISQPLDSGLRGMRARRVARSEVLPFRESFCVARRIL